MAQVFISYSRKDVSFAEQLVVDLEKAGLEVWRDVSSLGGGARWRKEIETAIRTSPIFIVVLSPDAVESEWVEREFLFASNLRRKIVPVMCRPCELPLNYLDLNYIDMQDKNYQRGFTALLKALAVDSKTVPLPDKKEEKISFVLKKNYVMALVGLLVLVFAAWLISPWRAGKPEPTPTPTPTATSMPTSTLTPTEMATATEYPTSTQTILVVTSTEVSPTPSPSPTMTFTPTPENTASPSPEPKVDKMTAILQTNVLQGKSPLKVNFDARESYVQFASGDISRCGNGTFCSYVFTIYRDSKLMDKFINNNGTLSYTCGSRGEYFVTVYICRGNACNDDGVTVEVK